MRIVSQLLLGVLLNACWQIALLYAFAALCSWLLRKTAARYRHLLWVAALVLSFSLPLVSSSLVFLSVSWPEKQTATEQVVLSPMTPIELRGPQLPVAANVASTPIRIGDKLATTLISAYLLILIFSSSKLLLAWKRTQAITRTGRPIEVNGRVHTIVENYRGALGVGRVQILSSSSVPVPLTVGVRHPSIILPEKLLAEVDDELLKSGIGHELIHISRRDYVFNLLYEIVLLPLSFHPAAALIRRRIRQTRELCCDELMAEKLQNAQVYARSLVQLATSPHLRRLAATTTVGIADADNLEVRIMSLLSRSKQNVRQKRLLLLAASLLLVVPCVAAASFALSFDVDQQGLNTSAERSEREKEEGRLKPIYLNSWFQDKRKEERQREEREREEKERAERGVSPEAGQEIETKIRREREEQKMRAERQAELAKLARISMDQAIQIATSKYPGTVMECSLGGEHWDESERKPTEVFYRVVIVSPNDPKIIANHVWVSATDGRIIKTEKEERDNESSRSDGREPISAGELNGNAISLPSPEYPAIARAVGAEGTVKVQVIIDETGNVIAAKVVSGHPLLQSAAVEASRQARFSPTKLQGEPVKVSGVITYNFVKQ